MSLFPAYATTTEGVVSVAEGNLSSDCASVASPARECQLLASDSEPDEVARQVPVALYAQDFYVDPKWDCGNLRVSTLYYPGRPLYDVPKRAAAGRRARSARRYFEAAPARAALGEADELAERTAALRRALAAAPRDEDAWLRLVHFQERCRGTDAALAAARDAAAALPRSRRVRAALHRARDLALAPHERAAALRADLAAPAAALGPAERSELWLRLLEASAAAGGVGALDAAAEAAAAATRDFAPAYPHLLYVYGALLRAGGLWERLVLLLELALAMNFPAVAAAPFPPPRAAADAADAEARLRDAEDEAVASGLPLSAVWVRVERRRAAAHWRPAPAGGPAAPSADPQRAPVAADVGALLRPAAAPDAAFLLLGAALRLAQVPLLPAAEHALRAWHARAAGGAGRGDALAAAAHALPALLRAARRLPAPARPPPALARRLLARLLDPPHCFDDAHGYLGWVRALWDSSLEWTSGERRLALLCWRLRWLHALALLLDLQEESGRAEARRIRGEARAALRRHAGGAALPFVHFARLESALGAAPAAAAAALRALRAALRDADCAPHVRLYVARLVEEVCGEPAGAWARACAALGRAPPPDAEMARAPPPELLRAAAARCEERCAELERDFEGEEPVACEWDGALACAAMLPGAGEWGAARAALAGPARRERLLREARARPPHGASAAPAARYWEQCACALLAAAARDGRAASCARALAHKFPHNALLALASGGAPLWAWARDASHDERERALLAPARSHTAALAHALPALLAEPAAHVERRAERACAAAARAGAGGALLAAARLDAARPDRALYDALRDHPHNKWLYVRGAARGGDAAALADALLERELRLHALLDELAPPPPPTPAPSERTQ